MLSCLTLLRLFTPCHPLCTRRLVGQQCAACDTRVLVCHRPRLYFAIYWQIINSIIIFYSSRILYFAVRSSVILTTRHYRATILQFDLNDLGRGLDPHNVALLLKVEALYLASAPVQLRRAD
jgi:hypothetical protein|eukprot:COSAG01_NODE_168_length_23206_cov_14.301467_14_plen_122_part_00